MTNKKQQDKILLNIYAVLDRPANSFGTPIFLPNEAVAVRTFSQAVNAKNTLLGLYPDDFVLCHLGTYDQLLGRFENLSLPKQILAARAVLNSVPVAPAPESEQGGETGEGVESND